MTVCVAPVVVTVRAPLSPVAVRLPVSPVTVVAPTPVTVSMPVMPVSLIVVPPEPVVIDSALVFVELTVSAPVSPVARMLAARLVTVSAPEPESVSVLPGAIALALTDTPPLPASPTVVAPVPVVTDCARRIPRR